MELKEAIAKYKEGNRLMHAYSHAMGVMYYDFETHAPKKAIKGFSETMGALSEITYKLSVNEERFALLDFLTEHAAELDEITRLEVEEEQKGLKLLRSISVEEFVEYRQLTSEATAVWHEAKVKSDYELFKPYLKRLYETSIKLAKAAEPDMDPYDYWLNEHEEGFTQDVLDGYFMLIKEELIPFIRRIGELPKPDDGFIYKKYPIWQQREFSDEVMAIMGIDPENCTLSETEHPFTTGFNKLDSRITTHYHEDFLTANMYSVIHEGGHATYEMNVGDELWGSPLAAGASSGMHESQSRFYENIIGRSMAFANVIFPVMKKRWPEQLDGVTVGDFFRAVNKAEPSLIRTEADELTYSLHILIRYEMEKKLMHGELSFDDVPAEWNRLYKEYLGIDVPSDREGCLQDTHWAGGMIGYFPSYSLGSAYGAQILASMKKEMDIDKLVSEGRISEITAWLVDHIYKYGRIKKPAELLRICCGEDFDPKYYIDYLKTKFGKVYGIE